MGRRKQAATPDPAPPRAVVGYCRVSTDEQAELGYGLAAQEERIRHYAAAMGIELADVIRDDGYSGATLDRPGLQQLLARIDAGEIGTVIVAKLDRLSRSLRDLLNLYDACFEARGVALVSVAEQFDTSTAAGRLFFQLVGSFAEFERRQIAERTASGRRVKASRGGYAGGGAPIGYRAERGSKVLHLDEAKAATVRRVFELAGQGYSCRQIAALLNAEGHTTAAGAPFTHVQVARILRRRILYAGGYAYAGVVAERGQHAAILA